MPPVVRFLGRPVPALPAPPAPPLLPALAPTRTKVAIRDLSVWYGSFQALKGVSLAIPAGRVTALVGPSGCGKSTFLRALNRMHDDTPGLRVSGQVLLDGQPVYDPTVDVAALRRRMGMIFQQPTPFPRSIFDNVAYGPRLHGLRNRKQLVDTVERCLRWAALWEEVRDRLHRSALELSGGQQQRLCLARALAVDPEVLLLDEPTAALDPVGTAKLEERILTLKERYTMVVVTHNLRQATRIADRTAHFSSGRLVEEGDTMVLFRTPRDPRTAEYLAGQWD